MYALYDTARRTFFVIPLILFPFEFFLDAPFGRFSPSADSIFLVDGVRSWIVMELVSPSAFIHAFANTPLASCPADTRPPAPAQLFLAGIFLVHYTNRALISPLRSPSRSKSHISVTIGGIIFNVVNGTLLGTYLRSSIALAYLADALTRPIFWACIVIWGLGFAGNVLHDEILLDIRRDVKAEARGRVNDDGHTKKTREYYGIPHGYLYSLISYPNYLCEWIEWLGFAIAAAPVPSVTSFNALASSIEPPWIFFSAGVLLMLPRAYKGHQWYLERFPDYPKDRKVVVPYVF